MLCCWWCLGDEKRDTNMLAVWDKGGDPPGTGEEPALGFQAGTLLHRTKTLL